MSTGSVDDRGLYNSDWSDATDTVGRLVFTNKSRRRWQLESISR